jgi:pilus assembly protein CpaF
MVMMSDVEMPLAAMRAQIGSGMQLIVQCGRLQDGSRKVTHVTEVTGFDMETQKYKLRDIFVRDYRGVDQKGNVVSELIPTGLLPECMHQLTEHGVTLPDPVMALAQRTPQGITPQGH